MLVLFLTDKVILRLGLDVYAIFIKDKNIYMSVKGKEMRGCVRILPLLWIKVRII